MFKDIVKKMYEGFWRKYGGACRICQNVISYRMLEIWAFLYLNGRSPNGWGSFFLHPYIFLPSPPQCYARSNCSYYFLKTLKCIWTIFIFFIPDCAIQKKFGLASPLKFWIHQSIIQNIHFILKKYIIQNKHSESTNP